METMPTLEAMHAKHAFAFKDLRSYAADDETTGERLAKLLAARNVSDMVRNRYCLEAHLAASAFIGELYDELCGLDRPECRRIFEAASVTVAVKLDYIAGKLGLIPAFGDSIGCEVNKAELSLCQTYAKQAAEQHGVVLTDCARLESALAALVRSVRAHNAEQTNLGACVIEATGEAHELITEIQARASAR